MQFLQCTRYTKVLVNFKPLGHYSDKSHWKCTQFTQIADIIHSSWYYAGFRVQFHTWCYVKVEFVGSLLCSKSFSSAFLIQCNLHKNLLPEFKSLVSYTTLRLVSVLISFFKPSQIMNVIHFLLLLFLNRFKEVKWNDKTIVVMDDVKIEPSYEEDKCSGSEQLLEHIIKIVSMFCNHGDYSWSKRKE